MIERVDLFHLPFYKKEAFTGSDRGLRFFIIKKAPEGAEAVLEVTIWPEPYALEHTEDDKKTKKNSKNSNFFKETLTKVLSACKNSS